MLPVRLLLCSFYVAVLARASLTSPSTLSYQDSHEIIQCVTRVLGQYFTETKQMTYVSMGPDDDDLLRAAHSTTNITLIIRQAAYQMFSQNRGYFIYASDVNAFTTHFEHLIREPMFDPFVRFLIVIRSVQSEQLRNVFDQLLKLHVNNVVLVNGTEHAHLYTYNPFEDNSCGKRYDAVTALGPCSSATHHLYLNQLLTGPTNCTFRSVYHTRPPFTVTVDSNTQMLGMEQYLLQIMSEIEGFKITERGIGSNGYGDVYPNMTAYGVLKLIQSGDIDIVYGAMILNGGRAGAFTQLCGYYDYVAEEIIAVKKAQLVPAWKYFYLEFDASVWLLLLVSLVVSSFIMIYFWPTEDKGRLVLVLVDNLAGHGLDVRGPLSFRFVLISWVLFAYLVNTFYQSSLVSLAASPIKQYQISNNEDIMKYNLKPYMNYNFSKYLLSESSEFGRYVKTRLNHPVCETASDMTTFVSQCDDVFTTMPTNIYLYNPSTYNDKWGDPILYFFREPLVKHIYCFYFYKGFPASERFRLNMLRMRDSGLADKRVTDIYYKQNIKHQYAQKEFEPMFVIPWILYAAGHALAVAAFFIELLYNHFAM